MEKYTGPFLTHTMFEMLVNGEKAIGYFIPGKMDFMLCYLPYDVSVDNPERRVIRDYLTIAYTDKADVVIIKEIVKGSTPA